jgi:methionyl-tRNA formyltransferase
LVFLHSTKDDRKTKEPKNMRYIYPLDMETMYGQIMLDRLLSRGLVPEMVIEEDSPRSAYHRKLWLDRTQGRELAPSIAYQVKKYQLPYARVEDLCSDQSEKIMRREKPDLTVVGGTRQIITKKIFSIAPYGTLISHPGLLPFIRGASGTAWSIYHDIQVAASCIIIDEQYDKGPVLETKIVPVYKGDSYEEVCERHIFACAELMADVVEKFKEKNGPIEGTPQDPAMGKTYKTIPAELVLEVKAKLSDGTYRWLHEK